MGGALEIVCPCCGNKMTLDAASGEILAEERPVPKPQKSFEEAMTEVQGGSQRREEAFSKAADKTRRLQDLLDKKFEEARKKAATDTSRPKNIYDAD